MQFPVADVADALPVARSAAAARGRPPTPRRHHHHHHHHHTSHRRGAADAPGSSGAGASSRSASPLVARLIHTVQTAGHDRVSTRVLQALSADEQDAFLAECVRDGTLSEREFLAVLNPRTRAELTLRSCTRLRNATLRRAFESCAALVAVDLSCSTQVNNSVVISLLRFQPQLLSLCLKGCARVSDAAFGIVGSSSCSSSSPSSPSAPASGEHPHELQSLNVAGCPQLTDALITGAVMQRFPALEVLNVSSCHRISNVGIETALCRAALRELRCAHLPLVDDGAFGGNLNDGDGDGCLSGASALSPFASSSITRLHLDGTGVTDRALRWLAQAATALEHCSLRWCDKLTQDGVEQFVVSCDSLVSIDVSDLGLASLSQVFNGRVVSTDWLNS